jgi:hypothetical protein
MVLPKDFGKEVIALIASLYIYTTAFYLLGILLLKLPLLHNNTSVSFLILKVNTGKGFINQDLIYCNSAYDLTLI